jgi:hypothetical protein
VDNDFDPFAHLSDEPDPGPGGAMRELLDNALRGYFPMRKIAVQRPNTEAVRAAKLSELLTGRHHRPLDAWLLLHALQPVLPGSPLPLRTWANLLSTGTRCTPSAASKAFAVLEELQLVARTRGGSTPTFELLHEDGSGAAWTRPGMTEETGPGYFAVPYAYWTGGWADRLTLPGKVMFLIILAETQNPKTPAFHMPVERAQDWYGISERSAERGYTDLHKNGLLLVRKTKVVDGRHPAGRRDVYWRALASPFSTADRARLQDAARTAARQNPAPDPEGDPARSRPRRKTPRRRTVPTPPTTTTAAPAPKEHTPR